MDDNTIGVSVFAEKIIASFAGRESATVEDVLELARALPGALRQSDSALPSNLTQPEQPIQSKVAIPAVPIDQSINKNSVVCLCCGKEFTMLKRHLKAEHGLTEDQYRENFGLAEDHTLVAPSYSLRRAKYAKQIGLGKYVRNSSLDEEDRPQV